MVGLGRASGGRVLLAFACAASLPVAGCGDDTGVFGGGGVGGDSGSSSSTTGTGASGGGGGAGSGGGGATGGGGASAVCGDGDVTPPEACDDVNTASGDGCDGSCQIEPSATCGNGTLEFAAFEECDDGNTTNGDGCAATCRVEAPTTCGNGSIDLADGEECDDGDTTNGDGCTNACQLEASAGVCGDSTLDPGELCDDGDLSPGDACNPTCRLTNTTSVFAGSAGVAGRVDGVGAAARFTNTGPLAADDQYIWMAEAPGPSNTPPGVLRRIEVSTATVLTVANIAGTGGIATNGVDTVWVAGGDTIQSIATAPPYTVTTIHAAAASGAGNFADGAPGTATFGDVRGLTWYGGSLWIVDTVAGVIRRMDPTTNVVTTVAGTPYQTAATGTDGVGPAAVFTSPRYIVSDGSAMLFISDTNGNAIRTLNAGTLAVGTFAGAPGVTGYVDATGSTARIHRPRGITADATSLYFAEFNAHTIRQGEISSAEITTVVGTSMTPGNAEGQGANALLDSPWGVVYHHPSSSLFFSDASETIRRIQ